MNSNLDSFIRNIALLVLAGVCPVPTIACHAQGIVDCVIQDRVRTPSVRVIVVDPTGIPLPDTFVVLEAHGEKVRQAKTETDGKFDLSASAGSYHFKVTHPYFAGITIDLVVGKDLTNAFSRSGLYAVLGLPGSFCPMVWTDANKFHRMINANKKQIEETVQNNATQK